MRPSIPAWLTSIAIPWLREEASVFGQGPLIIADAAESSAIVSRRTELGTGILVGIDAAREVPETGDVFDILLTTIASPPRPWVQVKSIADTVAAIEAKITSMPDAAVTLVQLLRAQRNLDFEAALTVESLAFSALMRGDGFKRWRVATPPTGIANPTGPPILVERDGAAMRIVLTCPDHHNAMTSELRDHLVAALREARLDPGIERVEIRAQGSIFCQGGAVEEFGTAQDLARAHQIRTVRSPALALHRLTVPTQVFIQGAAIGSGIEFAAAAREIIAQPSAFFSLPELGMGLIPGAGGTVTIARRIGWQRCCYIALTGVRLRARTALDWGLIDRIGD